MNAWRLTAVVAAGALLAASLAACQHASRARRSAAEPAAAHQISAEGLYRLAIRHARDGDLLRAEHYLVAARASGLEEEKAVFWLVRVSVAADRYRSALRHAEEYLRARPDDWRLRLVVASLHEVLGDIANATLELERVVRGAPQRPLPHYRLASLYRDMPSRASEAVEHFLAYLRLDPGGPHAAESRDWVEQEASRARAPRRAPGELDWSEP